MPGVGQQIRRFREAKGWNQAELAVYAGIGPSGISQIETGKRNPSAATLQKIADALGVGVADFFPKAEAAEVPLWSDEPPRRGAFNFKEARESLEGYCAHWEQMLADGSIDNDPLIDHSALEEFLPGTDDNVIDDRALEEFCVVGAGWIPMMDIALRVELEELRAATGLDGDELLGRSDIAQANKRYLDLFSEIVKILRRRIEEGFGETAATEPNVIRLQEVRDRLAGMQRQAVG